MTDLSTTRWLASKAFSELPPDAISLLETRIEQKSFVEGEYLLRQGDIGEEMFLISSGRVTVVTEDVDGQRHVIAHTGPGDILGEMALLAREPRTAHAIAEDAVEVQVLPATTFHTLVARHPEFSQFLTELVATRVGGPDRDVLVGRTMDSYRIIRRLGRGGMAVVYEAVDSDDRRVALKMMSHRLVFDEESRELFQQEADIIESFDHINIVKMFGRFAMFHTYFIVVEFIDGLSLQEVLHRSGALPSTTVRLILGQLVQALGFAHDSGIIHRDIKPGNVMLTRDGQIKLMDFGLAKPLGGGTAGDRILVGTPGYMAPEQFEHAEPQTTSDIFSLGCLAVELLTGKKLFNLPSIRKFVAALKSWSGWDPSTAPIEIESDLGEILSGWLTVDPAKRLARFDTVASWAGPVELPVSVEVIENEDPEATWIFDTQTDTTIED